MKRNVGKLIWITVAVFAVVIIAAGTILLATVMKGNTDLGEFDLLLSKDPVQSEKGDPEKTDDSAQGDEAKNAEDYTLEDYNSMTPEEKMLFPDKFASMEAYNEWYRHVVGAQGGVKPEEKPLPEINLGNKQVQDLTAEDYNQLTSEEKAVLPDLFDSMEAYSAWYEGNIAGKSEQEAALPEINLNVKDAEDLTLEDYNQLTSEEKAMLPDEFEDMEAYGEWFDRVVGKQEKSDEEKESVELPEIELAGKKAQDYTAEDYSKLTMEEKMLFPDQFDSMKEYKEWYERVIKKGN